VSADVESSLRSGGRTVARIAGVDRYATSLALADASVATGLSGNRPWLATGTNYPDALAAGPGAAADGGVLLLVPLTGLGGAGQWLRTHAPFDHLSVVGGPDVVPPVVTSEAVLAGG
jgi:hypothetical protein